MIDETKFRISVRRQCQLLDLSKSRYYYAAKRSEAAKARDKQAKQVILAWLLKDRCLGYRRLTTHVSNALQYRVTPKYVRRLMKELGLKAIYCKRNISKPHPKHEKVPYLIKGMQIDKPDMVWTTDITYLKAEGRTYYLCVVLDWASREVLGYSIGRNMTVELCHDALTMALSSGSKLSILNTDQGIQYTSESWLSRVRALGIKPSMDGEGSWRDNVRMERFWRTYKYELFNLYDDVTLEAIEKGSRYGFATTTASDCTQHWIIKPRKNGEKSNKQRLDPHSAKFFGDFSATAGLPPLRSGVALRATRPRLRFKIAKKLGLTTNAKNSNLTTAPSIGSEIP